MKYFSGLRDTRGNVAVMTAIAALPLLLSAGAATDYLRAYSLRTELQSAVDAAALAAATANTTSNSVKTEQASQYLHHTTAFAAVTPTVEFDGDAVTVSAATELPTSFMGLAGLKSMPVTVTATAVIVTRPVCLLALNENAAAAINIHGSGAHVSATDCVVHANSASDESLTNNSATTSVAERFCAVGGYTGTNYTPTPETKCRKVRDPYAGLPKPSVSGCDFNNMKLTSGAVTLDPGVYCGGIDIGNTANVSFAPGVYVLKDGPLSISSSGTRLSGAGVTFYLTGEKSVLSMTSGGTADISAPTTGPYAGLVFVADPANPSTKSNKVNGHANFKITGVGYFPTQELSIGGSGNFGATSPFMAFIADTLEFHGNGKLTMNFDAESAGYTMNVPREFSGTRLTN